MVFFYHEGDLSLVSPSANDFDPNYGAIAEMADGKVAYSAYEPVSTQPRMATHGVHLETRFSPEGMIEIGLANTIRDTYGYYRLGEVDVVWR